MALKPLTTLNKETHELFGIWYEDAMHPNLKMVAQRINISYGTLKNFNSGMSTSYNNLYKINAFLESQGYKLKEKI